ncbi:hypothetical protein Tco_0966537 [Tanacetum coccineum]
MARSGTDLKMAKLSGNQKDGAFYFCLLLSGQDYEDGPDLAGKPMNETSYRGMIGSLMYLTATRPDIQFSIVLCARYQSNLKESHLTTVKRILRYLKASGYAEAEYVAAAGCCASILWMKSQLSDYDIHYKMVPIFCDNTSAIAISNNPILHSRTKHIDIRYHFIKDHILKEDIELHFILTNTDVSFDPFPSTNEPEKRPLKKLLIKFSALNWQRPLTLDFHTICSLTVLDYNNGKYVVHPAPKVLGGNYSSTKQVNSIHQLLAYSLITRTEVDIGEIIYSDLDPPKVTDIELTVHMIVVNNRKDSESPPPLVAKPKKGKSQTVASTLPKSQGPEDFRALSKKRKKPKSKRPPTKTKESPPKPTEGSEQSHSVSSGTGTRQSKPLPEGTATHPKDSGGNKQPLDRDITSTTSNEGTAKTTPRPEGLLGDKDSGVNIPPADMEPIHTPVADPSRTGAKYQVDETQSTRLRYRSLTKNKGKTSSEVKPDTKPLKLQTYVDIQAFLLSDDELDKDSDEEEVLAAGDDIDEDPQDDKEFRTPSPKQIILNRLMKMSRVLFNRITKKQWEQHEEAAVSYADLKASIDQYYDENIAHRDQTDKLVEASMSSLDRSSITISDFYKGLNVITQLLKDISNAVKDDPATNQKLNEATETFARISSNVTKVLSLVKGFDFSTLLSAVKSFQDRAVKQEEASIAWMKSSTNMAWNLGSRMTGVELSQTALKREISSLMQDTSEIKSMMSKMYAAFQGQPILAPSGSVTPTLALTDVQANVEGENANTTTTEEPPSHTEGETEEPRLAIPISLISSIELVKASSIVLPGPDEPEEAEKIRLDPKATKGAKAGEMFKKAQDAEHAVLKRQHTEKVRKSLELRKHKYDSYMWTVSSRLKPEPITDIKIHPKTKPMVITVYRGTDGRNFEVHEPFLFGAFGIFELDELREIIPNKKNAVVKDLINSLSQRYERLKKIPEELGIHYALPAPAPEQAAS